MRQRLLGATVATLALSLLLQLAFFHGAAGHNLSDVPNVLQAREIGPDALPYVDRMIEYPVGIGVILWLTTLLTTAPLGVFLVTALLSAALALAAGRLLDARAPRRVWRWVFAPTLLLYAFENWDLFAIVPMLIGILAFERRRDAEAGIAVAVGATVKLFPAFLAPGFVALRLAQGDRAGAKRFALSTAITYGILNLPVLLVAPDGWFAPIRYQSRRDATWGGIWGHIYDLPGVSQLIEGHRAGVANVIAALVLAGGLAWVAWRAYRVQPPVAGIAAASVVVFLLSNKIYSPVYDLWLLPFFVLLPLSRRLFLAFSAIDVGIWFAVYGYFQGLHGIGLSWAVMPLLVIARTAVLVAVALRALEGEAPARALDIRSARYAEEVRR